MNIQKLFCVLALLCVSACSNFVPSPATRGVSFPLETCNDTHLAAAQAQLSHPGSALAFSKTWVCRTDVHRPPSNDRSKEALDAQAFTNLQEIQLRDVLEAPLVRVAEGKRPVLGIGLAGGGTKASAVGMGVLAGLSDLGLLDSADYISSVSGGGYASYFFYAHKIFPIVRKDSGPVVSTRDLFKDCVFQPAASAISNPNLLDAIRKFGGCREFELLHEWSADDKDGPGDNRYQAFVRCQQDVFKPGECKTGTTLGELAIGGETILGTFGLAPLNFLTSSLWDWGINFSTARRTYVDGIGVAYGVTVRDTSVLKKVNANQHHQFLCKEEPKEAFDCHWNIWNPDPKPLTFDELRRGLFAAKKSSEGPLPFWILNATAPQRRNLFGWTETKPKDKSNSDMFEMTAVSHGSGRYGYVSAPPSLHNMSVLDSVSASAAFLDSNQLLINNRASGPIGVGLHVLNLDWGLDIGNYNVSDAQALIHRIPPIPFFWLDSLWRRTQATAEEQDRVRSVYIRLMDGGNSENLGVFSLLKRRVQNIVISEAGQDTLGDFSDICHLAARVRNSPSKIEVPTGKGSTREVLMGSYFYVPGLANFATHCEEHDQGKSKKGYNLHAWPFEQPVLLGCIRRDEQPDGSCDNLKMETDTRLFIVKPAMNNQNFQKRQLKGKLIDNCWLRGQPTNNPELVLNCDSTAYIVENWDTDEGECQTFPQHSTVLMTANSNDRLFTAYRELSRQYVQKIGGILTRLHQGSAEAAKDFEAEVGRQKSTPHTAQTRECKPSRATQAVK